MKVSTFKPKVKASSTFLQTCRNSHPDINPDMMKGFATVELEKGLQYLFDTITNIIKEHKLQDIIQLVAIKPMTPSAIMEAMPTVFDISRSDLLLHTLQWNFRGHILTNRLLLPCAEGNVLTLADVRYLIIPEITDMVISILSHDTILITIIKKIIKISPQVFVSMVDDILYVGRVVFSRDLLKLNAGKIRIPLIIYKLIREGFHRTMESDIVIKHKDDKYNTEKYVKVSSRKLRNVGTDYILLIPKDDIDNKPYGQYLIHRVHQIMYMFDMIPGMDEEFYNMMNDDMLAGKDKLAEELEYWANMCSLILSDNKQGSEYNREVVTQHLQTLEYLTEDVSFKILEKIDIHVETYIDLLMKTSDCFTEWTVGLDVTNFDDKRLEVNPKLYKPITNRVARIMTELRDNTSTTFQELENKLKDKLRPGSIFDIKSDQSILYLKEQINANSVWNDLKLSTQNKRGANVEDLIPDASATTIGNLNIINKNIPYPTAFINPTLKIGPNRIIVKDPDMDVLTEKIKR